MIEPTVGRIVWIRDYRQLQPVAAIITYVHSITKINVCVFEVGQMPRPMMDVQLVQDSGDSDVNVLKPYATWMPYQKAVAAGEIAPTLHAQPGDPHAKG